MPVSFWSNFLYSETRKTDRVRLVRAIAARLASLPAEALSSIAYPVAQWLQGLGDRIYGELAPLLDCMWDPLLAALPLHEENRKQRIDSSWANDALNAPVGKIAQLLLKNPSTNVRQVGEGFATQSLADIEGSAIAPAIIESCPTRLFLANERALEPQIGGIYRRFGLNERQIEIIAAATPKRDYYCQSSQGNRLFDLGLGPLALAFAAASSRSDMNAITALAGAHGPDGFAEAWLRYRGLPWAAELVATERPIATDPPSESSGPDTSALAPAAPDPDLFPAAPDQGE